MVPVADTRYARATVEYALEAYDDARFVVLHSRNGRADLARSTAGRVESWLEELGVTADVDVHEAESYLFGPRDYAEAIATYAGELDVLLPPDFETEAPAISTASLVAWLHDFDVVVEVAPVETRVRRPALLTRGGWARWILSAAASFVFYLAVGGLTLFDVVTGAFVAALVATVTYRVTWASRPRLVSLPSIGLRLLVFLPYLGYEIAKANLQIAYVVLHPRLPIDPCVERFDALVYGGFPLSTLANSITLTPGTLTLDADGRTLHVHALTRGSREGLLDGYLERAVRFVFYGRTAMDVPTPRERGEGGEDD